MSPWGETQTEMHIHERAAHWFGWIQTWVQLLTVPQTPTVTFTKGIASVSHLETRNKSVVLLYKPRKSGHEVTKMHQEHEIQGAGGGFCACCTVWMEHLMTSTAPLSAQPSLVVWSWLLQPNIFIYILYM